MRLAEPYTFFVDRSLGSGLVPDALRQENERGVVHDEQFGDQDTSDVVWLKEAGARRWVVLTKDARIRTNVLERSALLSANVAAFRPAGLSHWHVAKPRQKRPPEGGRYENTE